MADSCVVPGNSDMYGIGIRLGFYLQWLASVLANFLMIEAEIKSSRFSLLSFTGAVIISLAVQIAQRTLTDLDIYIVLLLCFGASYAQVPIFLWRILTGFDANLDPTRWRAAPSSTFLNMFSTLVLVAIVVLQYVFWIRLPAEPTQDAEECQRYGFLFVPVSLYGTALKAVNLTLSTLLLLISSLGWIQWCLSSHRRGYLEQKKIHSTQRTTTLIRLRSFVNFIVAVAVIAGTELTLSWNKVQNISDLDTPGQLISFVLGVVVFSRVIWIRANNRPGGGYVPTPSPVPPPVWKDNGLASGGYQSAHPPPSPVWKDSGLASGGFPSANPPPPPVWKASGLASGGFPSALPPQAPPPFIDTTNKLAPAPIQPPGGYIPPPITTIGPSYSNTIHPHDAFVSTGAHYESDQIELLPQASVDQAYLSSRR